MPRSDPPPTDPGLVDLACELATAAGTAALRSRREHAAEFDGAISDKSSPTDLVTEFDRAAERLIVDALRAARPADGVIGEEGAAVTGTSGYEWAIDPIDGTTNYVYGLPSWCTSVAVSSGGHPVAGAVYVPVTDELFAATHGGGATLDGAPIRCSRRSELALALVATGFGYQAKLRRRQAARLTGMIGSIRDIRRLGSAAIDLCHVACSRVDAYFEEQLNIWDVAAGELIAREAGATSTDFDGGPFDQRRLVVAASGIHAALIALIGDADAHSVDR